MQSPTSPSAWMKSAPPSLSNGHMRPTLSETESMESISSSASSSIQAQIQQARANSLASRNILQHERENQAGSHSLVRSDSFRSTQSEKMFSGSQSDDLHHANSITQLSPTGQPSSPTPSQSSAASSRFTYPLSALSPTTAAGINLARSGSSANGGVPYTGFIPLSKISSKDDDSQSTLSFYKNYLIYIFINQ